MTIRFSPWPLLLLLWGPGSHAAVLVRNVRTWDGPHYTRLVFELSAPVTPHVFTLTHPRRLVVDLPSSMPPEAHITASGPIIQQVRTGRLPHGGERFVFVLRHAVRRHVFLLKPYPPYGYRLVVDMRDGGAPASPPELPRRTESAQSRRKLVIAIDPGHGG
ncbi:MAG TPA: AMIN domain-containing protein, partial [Acidiferrobacteraceae bacterium]|nr:AMIN domain-containing protein [Acidiferrobacteraceae bacterium]